MVWTWGGKSPESWFYHVIYIYIYTVFSMFFHVLSEGIDPETEFITRMARRNCFRHRRQDRASPLADVQRPASRGVRPGIFIPSNTLYPFGRCQKMFENWVLQIWTFQIRRSNNKVILQNLNLMSHCLRPPGNIWHLSAACQVPGELFTESRIHGIFQPSQRGCAERAMDAGC